MCEAPWIGQSREDYEGLNEYEVKKTFYCTTTIYAKSYDEAKEIAEKLKPSEMDIDDTESTVR